MSLGHWTTESSKYTQYATRLTWHAAGNQNVSWSTEYLDPTNIHNNFLLEWGHVPTIKLCDVSTQIETIIFIRIVRWLSNLTSRGNTELLIFNECHSLTRIQRKHPKEQSNHVARACPGGAWRNSRRWQTAASNVLFLMLITLSKKRLSHRCYNGEHKPYRSDLCHPYCDFSPANMKNPFL